MNEELYNWTKSDMLEVMLTEPDDFLKIKETLTRIGIASQVHKILYPSAHILHKKGKYYIMSFKELFCLDGKPTTLTYNDIYRRNTIAYLLEEWGMLTIPDKDKMRGHVPINMLKIIPFKDKKNWEIIPKYTLGGK